METSHCFGHWCDEYIKKCRRETRYSTVNKSLSGRFLTEYYPVKLDHSSCPPNPERNNDEIFIHHYSRHPSSKFSYDFVDEIDACGKDDVVDYLFTHHFSKLCFNDMKELVEQSLNNINIEKVKIQGYYKILDKYLISDLINTIIKFL